VFHREWEYAWRPGTRGQGRHCTERVDGVFPFIYDFRPATTVVSRLRGCRGDARRPRDDVLHRARRNLLTQRSRPDNNKDDWQDAAARIPANRSLFRTAASSCHLVSVVTRIFPLS